MKIFIAGSNTRGCGQACIDNGVPKLYSFKSEKNDIMKWDDANLLMVDSGAHSWNKETINKMGMKKAAKLENATTYLSRYEKFIKDYAEKRTIFVEYDVYGHLKKEDIDESYLRVESIKKNSIFMRVYHPMLDDGKLKILKEWIENGQTYIGIGNDSIPYLDKIFDVTKDKIRIHGFAMTKIEILETYPFFSVDSTTPISTVIFGNYADKYLGMKDKEEVIRRHSIEIFHEDEERLNNAIKQVKKTELYLTRLWERRKIKWNNVF